MSIEACMLLAGGGVLEHRKHPPPPVSAPGQRCHSFIQRTIASAFLVSQLAYDTVKALKLPDVHILNTLGLL